MSERRSDTVGMLPSWAARRYAGRRALTFDEHTVSYAEFSVEVDKVARALMAIGVGPGEHIALWIPNCPEFMTMFFAIAKIGAVAVPLNTRLRTRDLEQMLRQSDSITLIAVERSGPVDFVPLLRDVLGVVEDLGQGRVRSSTLPALERVVSLHGTGLAPGAQSFRKVRARATEVDARSLAARAATVKPQDTVLILYTSGTTGMPKGVMHSHAILEGCATRASLLGLTEYDTQLNYLPLYHMYSLSHLMLQSVLTGAHQVLMETFDPDAALRAIAEARITVLNGFDTHYRELLAAKARRPDVDTSSLRVGHCAVGLESSAAMVTEVQAMLCPTVSAYGMTELTGISQTFLDGTLEQRTRASGFPLPEVEVRIVDPDTGAPVPTGCEGEILARAPTAMRGYYRQPDQTAKTLDEDGWIHTGDAGVLREDGHLRFVGRYKDLIKVGGENVSPDDIESMMLEMPGVLQVAAVSCPDPRLQEVVAVFVRTQPRAKVDIETVDRHFRGKVASFKIPRRVLVIDEFPMTASGKIQKHELRARLARASAD